MAAFKVGVPVQVVTGLFLLAVSVFLWGAMEPAFAPLVGGSVVVGGIGAVVLRRRHAAAKRLTIARSPLGDDCNTRTENDEGS